MHGAQQIHQWTLMHTDLTSHVTLGKILNLISLYVSWRYNCLNFIALLLGINEAIYMKALTYFLTCCEYRMLLEILINYIIITLSVQYKSEIFFVMNNTGKWSMLIEKNKHIPLCVWNTCCLYESRDYNFTSSVYLFKNFYYFVYWKYKTSIS